MKLIANSQRSLDDLVHKLISTWNEKHYVRVTLTTTRDRSLDQNALWAAMYRRVSETLGDGSAADIADVKSYCKLMMGVPILRRDDDQFEKGWNRYFSGRSYEEQIFLMGSNPLFGVDGFPVTRLFNTKQGSEFTEAIDRHYSQHGVSFSDLLDGDV